MNFTKGFTTFINAECIGFIMGATLITIFCILCLSLFAYVVAKLIDYSGLE